MASRDTAALLTHFRSPGAARPALVGRERELGELVIALDAAARGEGGSPAHWPWVQVVRSLVDGLDGQALADALGPQAAGVLALAPELRDRLPDPPPTAPARDGESARFAAWDATTAFLARAATQRPLLIVLDDVHTADLPSLLL